MSSSDRGKVHSLHGHDRAKNSLRCNLPVYVHVHVHVVHIKGEVVFLTYTTNSNQTNSVLDSEFQPLFKSTET